MSDQVIGSLEVGFIEINKTLLLIQSIYGFPSLVFMIFFLFRLGCSKDYANSFYRLVQLDLLTNIFCYLDTWISVRLACVPTGVIIIKQLEYLIPGASTIAVFFSIFFMHMQFCSAASLSVHRITAVVFMTKFDRMWSRLYPFYFLICFTYSLIPCVSLGGFVFEVSIINGTLMRTQNMPIYNTAVYQVAVLSLIYFILLVILGISTAVVTTLKLRSFNSADRGVSKKLTKIALTYGCIYTGILLWSILQALNTVLQFIPDDIFEMRGTMLLFASDVMTLSIPYVLFFYDGNVKKDTFLRKCCCGPPANIVAVSESLARSIT